MAGHSTSASFLHVRAGRGFSVFVFLALLLSAAIGVGFYYSNLHWFAIDKTEEKLTALQLVDAFIAEYTDARAQFNGAGTAGAPVPASFRAHAIERFNGMRLGTDKLHLAMVGTPGREILTPPSDDSMVRAIRDFQGEARPEPQTLWLAVGGQPMFRTIYPSIATQKSCVDCHNQIQAGQIQAGHARWRLNDVMGAMVIDVPVGAFLQRLKLESAGVAGAAFAATLLLGLYLFALHARRLAQQETAEVAIRESEGRFRDFAETASDWYWETDAQHRFTYFSDRLRAYVVPEEYLGLSRIDIAQGTDPDTGKWIAHRALLERHEPFREFVYCVRLDDRLAYVATNGKPMFAADGAFLGYRGTSRDVTEQMAATERLHDAKRAAEAANRSKSEFLANMSHELRTPLNAIIGFADIIRKEMFGPVGTPQYKEYADDIAMSGGSLLQIINDILDMSKIEAGRLELRDDQVDVAAVVAGCRRLISARAEEADVTLECPNLPNLPHLRADELRIKQILLNLLSNAVKFTPPGGHITVTAGLLPEGEFEIAVTDTGIGMSSEQIQIALEPFRQLDNSLARRSQGTGLGLPLVRAFTELHGGRLRIHSTPGRGTTIAIRLPLSRVVKPAPAVVEDATF